VFTYWGPLIEFSRKSFIEERSFPWYALTSTEGSALGPPGWGVERLPVPPMRKNTATMMIITPITMKARFFEFITG
jgi:hypothetical protein